MTHDAICSAHSFQQGGRQQSPAMCEFAIGLASQPQPTAASTGRTAASDAPSGRRLWAALDEPLYQTTADAAHAPTTARSPESQMLQCARRFENRSEAVIRKRSLRLRYDGLCCFLACLLWLEGRRVHYVCNVKSPSGGLCQAFSASTKDTGEPWICQNRITPEKTC